MREANVIHLSGDSTSVAPVAVGGRGSTRAAAVTRDRTFHADLGHASI